MDMEELWAPPSPAAAEMIRTICERLLTDAEDLADSISAAANLALNDPGLLADPSLQKEAREFNRSDLVQWLTANVQHPGRRVEPYIGRRISDYIGDVTVRGLAPNYISGWRAALGIVWRRWLAVCLEYGSLPNTLIEVLDCSAHSIMQYALDSVEALHEMNAGFAIDHAGGQAIATIQLIVDGAPITTFTAEERLGYRMSRDHCAMLLWVDSPDRTYCLDEALTALRAAIEGHPVLIARSSVTSRWIWLSGVTRPAPESLKRVLAPFKDVNVSIGRTGKGMEGFRRSHQEALAAQALVTRLGSESRFTEYAEVELVDALTQDRPSARSLVSNTLGRLAQADSIFREALLTYIQSGFTATKAASMLHLHRNTVERRVTQANAMSLVKIESNPAQVAAALLVLKIAPKILESS